MEKCTSSLLGPWSESTEKSSQLLPMKSDKEGKETRRRQSFDVPLAVMQGGVSVPQVRGAPRRKGTGPKGGKCQVSWAGAVRSGRGKCSK